MKPNVSLVIKSSGGKRFPRADGRRAKGGAGMITDVLVLKDTVISEESEDGRWLDPRHDGGTGVHEGRSRQGGSHHCEGPWRSVRPRVQDQLLNVENPALWPISAKYSRSRPCLPSFYASGKIIADILKREGQIDAPAAPFDRHVSMRPL